MSNLTPAEQKLLDQLLAKQAATQPTQSSPPPQTIEENEGLAINNSGDFQAHDLTNIAQGGVYVPGSVGGHVVTGSDNRINSPTTTIHQAPDPAAEARRTYLKQLRDYCYALPLSAMGDDQTSGESVGLNDVYIALNTTSRTPLTPDEKKEREKERWRYSAEDRETRPLTAYEAAQTHARLVLLGDPGGGKTSFVRHLVATHAQALLDDTPGARLPLLMVLRDLAPRLRGLPHQPPLSAAQEEALVQAIFAQWRADISQWGGTAYCDHHLSEAVSDGQVLLIFDGLDELPEASRPAVWRALDLLLGRHRQVAQVIVTCRVRSYTGSSRFPAFTDHTLAPLTRDQVEKFVADWYTKQRHLGRYKPEEAAKRTQDLQRAASQEHYELAQNPLLLTVMGIIHQKEARLPDERVKLYALAVEVLLRRWQTTKEWSFSPALDQLLKDDDRIKPILERLAYKLHELQEGQSGARLGWGQLAFWLKSPDYLGEAALADEFLTYIDQRAGLLVGYGGSHTLGQEREPEFDFPHRTFQEYLAGCYLMDGLAQQILPRLYPLAVGSDYWRVALQLGLEELRFNRRGQANLALLAQGLLAGERATPRTQLWSGYVARLLGLSRLTQELATLGLGANFANTLQQALLAVVQDSEWGGLTLWERAEAGQLLNLVGDPRPGVGVNEQGVPDIMWGKPVPVGMYRIGGDKRAYRSFDEQEVSIKEAYQLAKYPITNAQFAAFVNAPDVHDPQWWKGLPEREKQFRDSGWPYGNHPRTDVSWYQAVAFCRWLSAKLGYEVRLPHEHEWEVAARYGHDKAYPWGDDEFDQTKLNANGTVGQTTAVGLYPTGRQTELDLYDMSGNVWEWCQNKYDEPEDTAVDASHSGRVLRGGSWFFIQEFVRVSGRDGNNPLNSNYGIGFRAVAPIVL